jgi:hypothetical protein
VLRRDRDSRLQIQCHSGGLGVCLLTSNVKNVMHMSIGGVLSADTAGT